MQQYSKRLQLPYSAEQLYDLVFDVESYPEFVPGWRSVRILQRECDSLRVEQQLQAGPLTWQFDSLATFHRPTRVTIESNDRPFRRLVLDWRFEPAGNGCQVHLDVTWAMRSKHLERLSKTMTPLMTDGIITAFERRAGERFGVAR